MTAVVVRWSCGCVRCVWPLPITDGEAWECAERQWAAEGCTWVDEKIDPRYPPTGAGCGHRTAGVEVTA